MSPRVSTRFLYRLISYTLFAVRGITKLYVTAPPTADTDIVTTQQEKRRRASDEDEDTGRRKKEKGKGKNKEGKKSKHKDREPKETE